MRFPRASILGIWIILLATVPLTTDAVTGHDCYTWDPNPPTPGGPAPEGAPHCVYYATGHFQAGLDTVLGKPKIPDCSEAQTGMNYACVYLPAQASDGNVKFDCPVNNVSSACDSPPLFDDDYFVADFMEELNTGGACFHNDQDKVSNNAGSFPIPTFVPQSPSPAPARPTSLPLPIGGCGGPGVAGVKAKITTPSLCFLDAGKASLGCFKPGRAANRIGDGLCLPISIEARRVPVGAAYALMSADLGLNIVGEIHVFNCPPFPNGRP